MVVDAWTQNSTELGEHLTTKLGVGDTQEAVVTDVRETSSLPYDILGCAIKHRVTTSNAFELFITVVIILVGAATGVELEVLDKSQSSVWFVKIIAGEAEARATQHRRA